MLRLQIYFYSTIFSSGIFFMKRFFFIRICKELYFRQIRNYYYYFCTFNKDCVSNKIVIICPCTNLVLVRIYSSKGSLPIDFVGKEIIYVDILIYPLAFCRGLRFHLIYLAVAAGIRDRI